MQGWEEQENPNTASLRVGVVADKLEFVNTYYHKDIYLKFSFVFPNIL